MRRIGILIVLFCITAALQAQTIEIKPQFKVGQVFYYECRGESGNNLVSSLIGGENEIATKQFRIRVDKQTDEGWVLSYLLDDWTIPTKETIIDKTVFAPQREMVNAVTSGVQLFISDVKKEPFQFILDRQGRFVRVENAREISLMFFNRMKDPLKDVIVQLAKVFQEQSGGKPGSNFDLPENWEDSLREGWEDGLRERFDDNEIVPHLFRELPMLFDYNGKSFQLGETVVEDSVTTVYHVNQLDNGSFILSSESSVTASWDFDDSLDDSLATDDDFETADDSSEWVDDETVADTTAVDDEEVLEEESDSTSLVSNMINLFDSIEIDSTSTDSTDFDGISTTQLRSYLFSPEGIVKSATDVMLTQIGNYNQQVEMVVTLIKKEEEK